jgi:transmembrane sensor
MSRADFRDVGPLLTEARVARQYAAIAARVPPRPRRGAAWVGWVCAAGLAVVMAVTMVRASRHQGAIAGVDAVEGAVVESAGADGADPTSIDLPDGSRVVLRPSSRARLTSARRTSIRLDVDRGEVEVEATHVEGRTFVVGAGPYEVHVVGTHFDVRRDPAGQVTVRVDRGVVEVASTSGAGATRRLSAGEQWSGPDDLSAPTLPAPASPPVAPVAVSDLPAAAAPPAAPPSMRREESARELFDDAQHARAAGHPAEAARAFDRLRRTFPHDAHAALAAFELGRLRLDTLGDPRGAEEALRDAIALGPASPFREDAESRRVEALNRMGDAAGCAAARDAYLARWPNGTYRRAVELGCGDR